MCVRVSSFMPLEGTWDPEDARRARGSEGSQTLVCKTLLGVISRLYREILKN